MHNFLSWTGAAPINYKIKRNGCLRKSWELRWKPVCGSTETELSKWLKSKPIKTNNPRAFLSSRQSYGKGQRGRVWHSPVGGVWLSAVVPWNSHMKSPGLFGLSVAVTLAHRIERSIVPVKIKWPNDLIVCKRKLAGFLPRVIYRGKNPTYMCLGIGLNVFNRVPKEGIALSELLGKENLSILEWYLEVLQAIEKAVLLLKNPEFICNQAERLLWAKQMTKPDSSQIWDIEGLGLDGQLKVRKGLRKESWNRWE